MECHKKISMFLFLLLSCIGISLLPVILYSALSILFFTRGLDSVHELQLKKYINDCIECKHLKGTCDFINVEDDYNNLPAYIKDSLPPDMKNDVLYKKIINNNGQEYLYCIISHKFNDKILYAIQNISKSEAESYISSQFIYTLYILLTSSLLILCMLMLFTWILIKRIKSPVHKLSQWANDLSYKNLNTSLPDFTYPELQHIAELIKHGVANKYEALNKEEVFWRYCSHELRTPISVIGVGLEVLHKMLITNNCDSEKQKEVIERLKRSTHAMTQVIDNILWLGRNKEHEPKLEKIRLDKIIADIILDMNKIFPAKANKVRIKSTKYHLEGHPAILKIVLENIIRNAYQHAYGGQIFVLQIKNKVSVINSINYYNNLSENVGFGIGIELTKRLAGKMKWHFRVYRNKKFNVATLRIPVQEIEQWSMNPPLSYRRGA